MYFVLFLPTALRRFLPSLPYRGLSCVEQGKMSKTWALRRKRRGKGAVNGPFWVQRGTGWGRERRTIPGEANPWIESWRQINVSQAEQHGAERTAVIAERGKHRDSVHAGGAAALRLESKASVEAARDRQRGPGPGRLRGAWRSLNSLTQLWGVIENQGQG